MTNRLQAELSPYLRQHADNPVDWYPWGLEALERALAEDRPILLSIGYAACHWCHVMAHESFEDDEVAALMNRLFVNVKVDREERPDLDHLYQRANQMLNGRPGGWPLTVFLTPDQTPFFSGTYFPKQSRHGLIGFIDLMERIDEVWRNRRADLEKQNASIRQHLAAQPERPQEVGNADPAALTAAAIETLAEQADPTHGGLGSAPKFPHPVEWRLLLRHGDDKARSAALHTLRVMAMGGLQDQVGGGFYRYCVDDDWQIPHFEKMLYDNALLLGLYAEAHCAAPDPLWVDAAESIVEWLQREMVAEGPSFCASLDADSDHEEGAFYVWTPEEVRAVIGESSMRIARPTFGLDGPPNFEGNAWHLRRRQDDLTLATALGLSAAEFATERARLRGLLLAERETRVRPGLDNKQITAWNALMCTGLLRAGRLLQRGKWITLAQQALDALRRDAVVDGRLRSIRQHGAARLNAYLDDHAFLLEALVESLQSDYRESDLAFAEQIAAAIVEHFQDAAGVLWMTSDDHETLLSRPRNLHDNAIPSGAAVAVGALARLGTIAGNPRWNEAADRAFAANLSEAAAYPAACGSFWLGAGAVTGEEPVLSIRAPSAAIADWRRSVDSWLPASALVCWQVDDAASPQATLCHHRQCHPPADDPTALGALWEAWRTEG